MARGRLPPGTGTLATPGRTADALKALLHDRWELYDAKRMRRLKTVIIGFLMPVLFVIVLFLVNTLSRGPGGLSFEGQALIALVLTLVLTAVITAKLLQMDRAKVGWSFSALQDARLDHEGMLALCRAFLSGRGFTFTEKTRRTTTLFITYFDVSGKDFSMPLWFSKMMTPPVVELGFGPETAVNRGELRELQAAMSATFATKFGTPA